MSRAVEKCDERVVKLLLENGAQLDFGDEKGQTLLLRAVETRNAAIVQHLLAKQVELDYRYEIVSERHPYLNESLLH